MSMGHGYELTGLDMQDAYRMAMEAAAAAEQTQQVRASLEQVLASDRPMAAWMKQTLGIVL